MTTLIVDIDRIEFNKDRFLQRVPVALLAAYANSRIEEGSKVCIHLHLPSAPLEAEPIQKEIANYLGPKEKRLYHFRMHRNKGRMSYLVEDDDPFKARRV